MQTLTKIVLALVIIGAINWGLVGFFNWNLVDAILGGTFSRIVYAIVGISGLALLFIVPRLTERSRPTSRPGTQIPQT